MTFEELIALGGAWAWATYAKEGITATGKKLAVHSGDKAKEFIEAGLNQIEWKLAAKKYRAQIRNRYGTIRILGRPSPVLLEGVFTDVSNAR